MNYSDCIAYIEAVPRFTGKTDVEHTRRLLDAMGSPDRDLRIYHVAGTNGKGSVCAYLQAVLTSGGYRTARFTSPHLEKINERLAIDGEAISDEDFANCFSDVMVAVRKRMDAGDPHPTYFELLFLVAMRYFADSKVDFCIFETGLGGRLDATNSVYAPIASVITSIGLDHREQLGASIRQIAAEKAGIIRPGVPVFCDGENETAAKVVREVAKKKKSPCCAISPDAVSILSINANGMSVRLLAEGRDHLFSIRQIAEYQARNAALAFLTLQGTAAEHGLADDRLSDGLLKMEWPGRMEMLRQDVYIDGAHNAEGAAAFARCAQRLAGKKRRTLLFAVATDKPAEDMVRAICDGLRPDCVITTAFSGGRARSGEELTQLFRKEQVSDVTAVPAGEEAFAFALEKKEDGVLFVAGSLYLLGEFREWFLRQGEKE